jgi:hypothetical protein
MYTKCAQMKRRIKAFYDKYLFYFPDIWQYLIIIVGFLLCWMIFGL